jgi:hypothetical protein
LFSSLNIFEASFQLNIKNGKIKNGWITQGKKYLVNTRGVYIPTAGTVMFYTQLHSMLSTVKS